MNERPVDQQVCIDKKAADSHVATDKDGAEPAKPASFANYARILHYGSQNGGIFFMILALVCAVGSGVALPLMNIVFGNLVGHFNEYFLPDTTVTEGQFKATVNKNALIILYLFIGKFTLTYIAMFCFRIVSLRVSARLRLEYMQSLFAQPVSKLDEISVGTVANTITALSNTIQQSVSDKLAILFQSLALLVAAYAIAFRYSWALTLVASSAILFVLLSFSVNVPILIKGQQRVDKADEKHASIAAEVFNSIRTVFSLGAEASLSKKYRSWIDESRKRGLKLSSVLGLHLGLLFFAMYASFALAFWFGLKLYREGHIANIGTVVTVFFSVLIVVTILGAIASPLMIISKAASASGAFFDLIDSERISLTGLRDPDVSSQADIEFRNVAFAYPTRPGVQVLKGLNAKFQKGKTTALVGPSGSGKSTIVGLIERWYELKGASDAQGAILVDDKNINSLDLKWWRSQIGLVQQEPFLFNDSILNNVAFGLVGSKWEHEEEAVKVELVKTACREAFAEEFIQRLPQGYATIVGESGIKLSGGQRQRLAIARSIVKQPAILILDEATSSIDVHGERIVQAALDRVSKDRTTIMIAHRLSTVRQADHIIVMKDGVKIEEGSHSDLLAVEGGMYHSLVNAQQLEAFSDSKDEVEDVARSLKEEPETHEAVLTDDGDEESNVKMSKKKGFFTSFGTFLYEQCARWLFYVLILLGAMGAGSAFALQSWLFAKLVDVFRFTGQKLVDAANFWSLMFFVLALAMMVCYFVLGYASNSLSVHVAASYRNEYFQNILNNPISFYDREENASGSLISRLSTDPKQLQEFLGANGAFPLISIFNMIGCVAIAFSFGWKLTLVALFAAMPFLFLAAYMRIGYELQFEAMNAEVYAGSSQFATEAIGAFRTVTALTMENTIIEKYSALLRQQRKKAFRKARYATLVFAFSDSIELCAMALTFWYGGQLLASREYNPAAFFVIYVAIIQGGQAAGQFFSFGPNIAQATASADRILSSRHIPDKDSQDISEEKALSPLPPTSSSAIEFRDVSFKYPTRNVPTFSNLNVSISSGQFVAFVGPSGCGKTTVISLLERFYDPVAGEITFGGTNIGSIEMSSYRRALSLVAQEPKLFDGTIRENLLLGLDLDPTTTTTTESAEIESQMIQACKDAEIHDFIMSLPEGYATQLGINAQTSLSGGQKQRLCIARALIRKPWLLLLDEATSSLDSQSEKLVQGALERLAAKKSMTIVAVAHRLATIQKADVIFVFGESKSGKGSRIVERGSHAELVRRRGVYWQMCQAQALDR